MRKLTLLALSTLALTLAACSPATTQVPQPAPAPADPGTLPLPVLTLQPYAPLTLTPDKLRPWALTLNIRRADPAQVVYVRISENGVYSAALGGSEGVTVLPTGLAFGPLRVLTVFEASVDGVTWVEVARYACLAAACR